MQDLNDKITGNKLTAEEWNEVPSEIQNVITQSGQTLSSSDLTQLRTSLLIVDSTTNDVPFTGTATFAVGEGIVFNGDAVTAANTLDDYEEGTWTPVLSDGTNDATMSAGTATYTKIGRQVTLNSRMSTSSLGSVSGSLRITGLPFTPAVDTAVTVSFAIGLAITAGHSIGGLITATESHIGLVVWDATTGTTSMQATEWTADGDIVFSTTYNV